MRLVVCNLPAEILEPDLQQMFAKFGRVTSVVIALSGTERLGFVDMPSRRAARAAMAALDGIELYGLPLSVEEEKAPV